MDLFFLSWAFDRRWVFKVANPCHQLIFTIPLVINIATIVTVYIQKSIYTQIAIPFFFESLVLLLLLALSNLYIIYTVRQNVNNKMATIKQNYWAIHQFYQDYQLKKIIWSFVGLIVTILAICQTMIQNYYINSNQVLYPCFVNKIRYYIDLTFYAYILMHILLFLVVKLLYLFSAWVFCPKFYLKLKRVIQ